MELTLEAVALFALKLVHETEDGSPILRDDLVMDGYEREVFGLLVRTGDLTTIQRKLDECMKLALETLGVPTRSWAVSCKSWRLKSSKPRRWRN